MQRACSDGTRGNGLKLQQDRFRLDRRRKSFFTVRVVKRWKRLPGDVAEDLSLKTFKTRLEVALGCLLSWRGPC